MTRKALLTGATGFLGRHLAARLVADGWHVTALQRRASSSSAACAELRRVGVEIAEFDEGFQVQQLARASAPDAVFHLATHYLKAHVADDVPTLIDANIAFGTHLLEGLRGSGVAVVSAMSYFQFSEGMPHPMSLYSATKQAFLDICEYYRVVDGADIRQVVLFDTFGPGDTRDKLMPHLFAALSERRQMKLGPSTQPINLLYVDDVVAGLLAAAGSQQGRVLALKAVEATTVGEVVKTLGAVAGVEIDCTFNEGGAVNESLLSAGEWPAPHGWARPRSLVEGLDLTWRQVHEA